MSLTRNSTALFAARILTLGERHRCLAGAMIAGCGISTLVLLLIIAFRSPLGQPWKTLNGSQEMVSILLPTRTVGNGETDGLFSSSHDG